MLTRRRILEVGGVTLAAFVLRPALVRGAEIVDIEMTGKPDGSDVWFDPIGLHIQPGQTIRWTNRDAGNSHTATAYHPSLFDRQQRIPEGAEPWDSDYLLPGDSFSVTLTVPGVYDYYCVPHEHAGMVGRIVVGDAPAADYPATSADAKLMALPDVALAAFPSIADIVAAGAVQRK
ncbi:plastocyanin/azurin family copper-binding protein [Devosia sp. A449]